MRLKIACAALLLATAAGSAASEIYQWKDARGVTHYSETPPPAGTPYQVRRITESGASRQPAEPAQARTVAEPDPQCTTARSNIELLQADGPVHREDGDGNTRELDADERASQLELARAAVRAYCRD